MVLHKLLERQLKKVKNPQTGEIDLELLLALISRTYEDSEMLHATSERAMQLMSDELNAANAAIRLESEKKISQSDKRFEMAVRGTQDGIWDWRVAENKVWFSQRALAMLGLDENAFADAGIEKWHALVDPDDANTAQEFIDMCLRGGEHPAITIRFRDTYNNRHYMLCRAQSIKDEAGQVIRVVGVHTDLTQVMAMQEELRKAKDKAEAANRAKSDFLANMTHELRTPLNSVISLSRMASESTSDSERRKFQELVSVSSELLLAIVNDILDFSKIEAREMHLESIPFDLVSTVGKALIPVRYMAAGKGLDFKIAFDCGGPIPFMVGDPYRLGQVITNIGSNAVKYTAEGTVSVITEVEVDDIDNSAGLTIKISDTGIGIPPDRQKVIFEKFTQADTSTTRRYGGTGLGLAISASIVELMGGEIALKSTIGEGSTFVITLRLPLAKALQPEGGIDTSATQNEKLIPVEDARVLVVEDHPVNQIVVENVLRRFGFKSIAVAENGKVALGILKQETFDLVIMDCYMPEMDGYQAATEIRKSEAGSDRHLPIIAITANASVEDKQRCLAAGMDHYTVKPLVERELLKILAYYVRIPEMLQPAADHEFRFTKSDGSIPSIDLSFLMNYSNGVVATEKMLVDAFLVQTRINLAQLEEGMAKNDAVLWRRGAHTLKGGARSIGAELLGRMADRAQELGHADKSIQKAKLDNIAAEFLRVEAALNEHLSKALSGT
ncbi:MAG: response regulator [Alphaproteobacteria bacterium]|nr:response regulator [Alphaproteobacteria bacterium]